MQQAILLHNKHWEQQVFDVPIKRNLLDKLLKFHTTKEIQVIAGLRRSGKSSLLKLYINELIKTENPLSVLFINLDDPNFSELYKKPEKLYAVIETAEKLTQTKIQYLFLDEIQVVEGWEKYIKSVYDADRFKKICITGSNSQLLMGNYSGLLSGRYILHQLYPLSIAEVLNHFGFNSSLLIAQNKSSVMHLLDKLLKYGCFPEIVLKTDNEIRHEILINYYDSILIKDCMLNKKIRDGKSFKETAYYIFNNLAALYSYNNLAKIITINDVTLKEYIQAMHDAFLIYEVQQFSYKIKQQLSSKRKLYAIDNGLINAISLNFSENKGKLFENLVFSEIRKITRGEVFLYNETKECDFIIKQGNTIIAVQAAYELNVLNKDREFAGLVHVNEKFGITRLWVVCFAASDIETPGIEIIPIYELALKLNELQATN